MKCYVVKITLLKLNGGAIGIVNRYMCVPLLVDYISTKTHFDFKKTIKLYSY